MWLICTKFNIIGKSEDDAKASICEIHESINHVRRKSIFIDEEQIISFCSISVPTVQHQEIVKGIKRGLVIQQSGIAVAEVELHSFESIYMSRGRYFGAGVKFRCSVLTPELFFCRICF